jgi:hypothetical protein
VAQIINDHACVTFADLLAAGTSLEADLDRAVAHALAACLDPPRLGPGATAAGVLAAAGVDFGRLCAASDEYLAATERGAPNVAMVPLGRAEPGREGVGVFAVAARDVAAGEELLYCYGLKWYNLRCTTVCFSCPLVARDFDSTPSPPPSR